MIYPATLTLAAPGHPPRAKIAPSAGFGAVLDRHFSGASGVRLSAHAAQRLQHRGIRLADEELARIGGAVDLAARKGARESLVLSGPLALVVSVPNRMVITALETDGAEASVFTQIDSVVVLPVPATPSSSGLDPIGEALNAADRPMRRNAKEIAS